MYSDEEIIDIINKGKGRYVTEFTESDFNTFVITGPQAGNPKVMHYIGKVVQVRLEAGDYGSNLVFLRHVDDSLVTHANQWFFKVSDEYIPKVEEMFKDTHHDKPKTTYSIVGSKKKRKGFIIPSKVKPGESTPMRDIKAAISNKIDEIINTKGEE